MPLQSLLPPYVPVRPRANSPSTPPASNADTGSRRRVSAPCSSTGRSPSSAALLSKNQTARHTLSRSASCCFITTVCSPSRWAVDSAVVTDTSWGAGSSISSADCTSVASCFYRTNGDAKWIQRRNGKEDGRGRGVPRASLREAKGRSELLHRIPSLIGGEIYIIVAFEFRLYPTTMQDFCLHRPGTLPKRGCGCAPSHTNSVEVIAVLLC